MISSTIEIRVLGRKIFLKMPKNDIDIHFVKGITYSRWNQNQLVWEVPHYPGNLDKLMAYFGDRVSLITEDETIATRHANKPILAKNEVLIIKTQTKRLKLLFGFISELIKHIKTIPMQAGTAKTNGGQFLTVSNS